MSCCHIFSVFDCTAFKFPCCFIITTIIIVFLDQFFLQMSFLLPWWTVTKTDVRTTPTPETSCFITQIAIPRRAITHIKRPLISNANSNHATTHIGRQIISGNKSYLVETYIEQQHISGDNTYQGDNIHQATKRIRRQHIWGDNSYQVTTHINQPLRSGNNSYQASTQIRRALKSNRNCVIRQQLLW